MYSFECFNCQKVIPLVPKEIDRCPSCGSENGQLLDKVTFKEKLEKKSIFEIDPKTGKPKG